MTPASSVYTFVRTSVHVSDVGAVEQGGGTAIFYSLYSANGLRGPKAHRQADCWEQRWLEKGVVLKTVFVATDESVV